MNQGLDPDLALAHTILRRHLPEAAARLWLFGSRARGDARRWSDIDVAVEPLQPLAPELFSEVREALVEANILLDVDLVDLSEADASFRASIRKEAVEWKE